MKRSLIALIVVLFAPSVVLAHPRIRVFAPIFITRSAAPQMQSATRFQYQMQPQRQYCNNGNYGQRYNRGGYGGGYGYSGGGYYGNYSTPYYQSSFAPSYGGQSAVVVVSQPKPKPSIEIVNHNDDGLKAVATSKFCFARKLDEKQNKVELQIIARDFHSDSGALKKVKFQVRWVEVKVSKDKNGKEVVEEKKKDTTIKLKFDEYGRFTEYCD